MVKCDHLILVGLIQANASFSAPYASKLGYIGLHEYKISKPFLNNVVCHQFARSSKVICVHSEDPSRMPGVLASQRDEYIYAYECHDNALWNLARVQSDKPVGTSFGIDDKVQPVTVYVVDTYIDINHQEFEGRARLGYKNVEGTSNSHGTHVAGIIAGKYTGVAKKANIVSVQVLDDSGQGKWSGMIAGLSYISKEEESNLKSVVVNMSIGGGKSEVVKQAIDMLVKQGITVVVAAGNSNVDACTRSPSDVESAITVGSVNKADVFSSFSNYGYCVDILAPGENIKSSIPGGGYGVMSGTSMATPHVSGLVANIIGKIPNQRSSPLCIKQQLSTVATTGMIGGDLKGTVNKLSFERGSQFCLKSLFEKWMHMPFPQFGLFQ